MRPAPAPEPLRPRDLALLLLAAGALPPRQRARDQQADRAGLELHRRLLDRLAALDPEPADLDAALARVVEDLGPPTGPSRALALAFREDWGLAARTPEWVAHLLAEAMHASGRDGEGPSRGRRIPP
jgi:hypothetical protein